MKPARILKEYVALSRGERNGLAVLILLILVSVGVRLAVAQLGWRSSQPPETPMLRYAVAEVRDSVVTYRTRRVYPDRSRAGKSFNRDRGETSRDRHESARRTAPEALPPAQGGLHRPSLVYLDLNSADSTELLELPGIGTYFASRIVRFRDKLGGYHHPGQLLEIYHMKPETVERILPRIFCDTTKMRKLDFNQSDWKTLAAHPYLNGRQAKAVVAYREQHGLFSCCEELSGCLALDSVTLEKIRPYFAASKAQQ
jgi:DNA uptake protein ComE-like DNA-binding protein